MRPGTPRNLLVASALGAIVLGIGGRVLMRIIALANGSAGGFSIAGSLEVVAAGALFGALGGLVLLILDRARLHRRRAVILTVALFLIIGLASDAARGAASRIPAPSCCCSTRCSFYGSHDARHPTRSPDRLSAIVLT